MKTSDGPLWAQPAFRAVAGATWRPGGEDLTRHGLALCAFARGSRVLDVGCGTGATLALLRGLGCEAVGLDSTISITDKGRGGHPVICGDAAHLPFASAGFDGLVMECVLSLMADSGDVLRQCGRILKPGGRMLLTDMVAKDGGRPLPEAILPQDAGHSGRPGQAGISCHERALSRSAMEALFMGAGLSVRTFEDHTAELRELAARLVWYGQADRKAFCACGTGYGLWILEKGDGA